MKDKTEAVRPPSKKNIPEAKTEPLPEVPLGGPIMDAIKEKAEANPIITEPHHVTGEERMDEIERPIHFAEFIPLCLVTESKDFDVIRDRLLKDSAMSMLASLAENSYYSAPVEDLLKKHIFYGAAIGKSEGVGAYKFTDDVRERMSEERNIRLLHSILGLLTEVRELQAAFFSYIFNGGELDLVNLKEEFGDTMWYQGLGLDACGEQTFLPAMDTVIRKLKRRFGDKFTEYYAINRDLAGERQVLEENYFNLSRETKWKDENGATYTVLYQHEGYTGGTEFIRVQQVIAFDGVPMDPNGEWSQHHWVDITEHCGKEAALLHE